MEESLGGYISIVTDVPALIFEYLQLSTSHPSLVLMLRKEYSKGCDKAAKLALSTQVVVWIITSTVTLHVQHKHFNNKLCQLIILLLQQVKTAMLFNVHT